MTWRNSAGIKREQNSSNALNRQNFDHSPTTCSKRTHSAMPSVYEAVSQAVVAAVHQVAAQGHALTRRGTDIAGLLAHHFLPPAQVSRLLLKLILIPFLLTLIEPAHAMPVVHSAPHGNLTLSPFSLLGYDCRQPRGVHDIKLGEAGLECAAKIASPVTTTSASKIQILQKEKRRRLTGYRCELRRTQRTASCGVWSHETEGHWPASYTLMALPLTTKECSKYLTTLTYETVQGREVKTTPLAMNQVTEVRYDHAGARWWDTSKGKFYCRGASVYWEPINMQEYYAVTVSREDQIKLEEVDLVVSADGSTVMTQDGIQLPCAGHEDGCKIDGATYVWKFTKDWCPLASLRT